MNRLSAHLEEWKGGAWSSITHVLLVHDSAKSILIALLPFDWNYLQTGIIRGKSTVVLRQHSIVWLNIFASLNVRRFSWLRLVILVEIQWELYLLKPCSLHDAIKDKCNSVKSRAPPPPVNRASLQSTMNPNNNHLPSLPIKRVILRKWLHVKKKVFITIVMLASPWASLQVFLVFVSSR